VSDAIVIELLRLIPAALWFALVVALLIANRRLITTELLPRVSKVSALGLELTLREQLEEAAKRKSSAEVVAPTPMESSVLARRVSRVATIVRGARVLWVDDHPTWVTIEMKMLQSLGIRVDTVTSTADAVSWLAEWNYDLVISDIVRGDDVTAGLQMLETLRRFGLDPLVVFYVANLDQNRGTPALAFGITNRPDELLHFVLDAIERQRS
jgi:CheY-like chemotaxis protein